MQALETIAAGGWVLAWLGAIALILYTTLLQAAWHLRAQRPYCASLAAWRTWIGDPSGAPAPVRETLAFVADGGRPVGEAMARVRDEHLGYAERRMPLLRILIAAAPLTGLLGTVTGMHQTFAGLGEAGSGGAMNAIAGGISQALVTTQAGLVIAVPALLALHPLRQAHGRLKRSLFLLESLALRARAGASSSLAAT